MYLESTSLRHREDGYSSRHWHNIGAEKMKVGDLVRYTKDTFYIGTIVELGETMNRVRWYDLNIVEWMPKYALEVIGEAR